MTNKYRVHQSILVILSLIFAIVGCTTGPPPNPVKINSFTATPSNIILWNSSTLSWSVSDYKSLSISPGVGAVSGTNISVSPTSTTTYTLTASGTGGPVASSVTVAVKTIADTLSYTDPTSGAYRLVKNTGKSSVSHLVLDLVGPAGSLSGVGFYLASDQNRVAWAVVDAGDTEMIKSSVFSNAIVKSKVIGNTLQAGVYQKGIAGAISAAATTVLASVALNIKSGMQIANPPSVNLTAVSGKAIILNSPASSPATTSIAIDVGALAAN